MSKIKVAITDDHNLFREGMRMLLANMPGIELCLEASSGTELLEKLETIAVDVVLLDIEMEEMSGITALKEMNKMKKKPKVVMLSMHNEPGMISHLMEIGASSYLQKDVKKEELEKAIRVVNSEGIYINDIVSRAMLLALKSRSNKRAIPNKLTNREKEVLELICNSFSNKEISNSLCLSERTVEGHRSRLMEKLGAKNAADLVVKALRLNLF